MIPFVALATIPLVPLATIGHPLVTRAIDTWVPQPLRPPEKIPKISP